MRTLLAVTVVLGVSAPLAAQSAADSAQIKATALDYVEGWYEGSGERMERALHPDLAKRIVRSQTQGQSQLGHMTAAQLVDAARRGGGRNTPADKQIKNVRIYEIYGNTALVRAEMSDWVDFMQMAKWNGKWVIVNVLWEMKPRA